MRQTTMKELETLLKSALNYRDVRDTGRGGGGCINQGSIFKVTKGEDGSKELIFVKMNSSKQAKEMFEGEMESLKAIQKTGCILVPRPIAVLMDDRCGGSLLVMEALDISGFSACSRQLGSQLADLHLHNIRLGQEGSPDHVDRFGFHVPTCCGSIPQSNKWNSSWTDYYTQKLQEQMDLVGDGDKEAQSLWGRLKPKVPGFFSGIDPVMPSLLHGDLWSGNAGSVEVVFDAASFYGHHEYDLGIAGMFGGFGKTFYDAYHAKIPKAPGFEDRHLLYKLFHNLNHWNHFGDSYRASSISIMKRLLVGK